MVGGFSFHIITIQTFWITWFISNLLYVSLQFHSPLCPSFSVVAKLFCWSSSWRRWVSLRLPNDTFRKNTPKNALFFRYLFLLSINYVGCIFFWLYIFIGLVDMLKSKLSLTSYSDYIWASVKLSYCISDFISFAYPAVKKKENLEESLNSEPPSFNLPLGASCEPIK